MVSGLALLLASLASPLGAADAGPGPGPKTGPAQPRYDHFIYLRHNNEGGTALTDSLVLVKVTAESEFAKGLKVGTDAAKDAEAKR